MNFNPIAPDDVLGLQEKKRMMWLFTERKERGVTISEMNNDKPYGLGIKQYNRCIKQLRDSGTTIICIKDGLYILPEFYAQWKVLNEGHYEGDCYVYGPMKADEPVSLDELEAKLEVLRLQWVEEKDPVKKQIILRQGNSTKILIKKYQTNIG